MLKNRIATALLFLAALALGLMTITLWHYVAYEALFNSKPSSLSLSEFFETTIYEATYTILSGLLVVLVMKQLVRMRPWWRLLLDLFLLITCVTGAVTLVRTVDHITLVDSLDLYIGIITSLDFWKSFPLDAFQIVELVWIDVLISCLLATSFFLILTLSRKAAKNGQKHWIAIAICLVLLLTLGMENLDAILKYAPSSEYVPFFLPDSLHSLLGFLWDAAPFLGLSAPLLAYVTREKNTPLPYKVWWVGVVMAFVLCLDLPAMIAEIRDILTDPNWPVDLLGVPVPFWPITPTIAIGSLVIVISFMMRGLYRERRTRKEVLTVSTAAIEQVERKNSLLDTEEMQKDEDSFLVLPK